MSTQASGRDRNHVVRDRQVTPPPDDGCYTLPDGDCLGTSCMHTQEQPQPGPQPLEEP